MNLLLEQEELVSQKQKQGLSSKNDGRGPTSAGWGMYAIVLWLIVLLAAVTFWALYVTILFVDMGEPCGMFDSEASEARLQFTASPTVNREHYEQLVAVGKSTSPYTCTYIGQEAQCYNEAADVKIDIRLSPLGPLYELDSQPVPNDQRHLELQP